MRQFKPLKKDKPNNKQKAIRKIQEQRFIEEQRKPRVKRNGILIPEQINNLNKTI